jgi:hypothetical protein
LEADFVSVGVFVAFRAVGFLTGLAEDSVGVSAAFAFRDRAALGSASEADGTTGDLVSFGSVLVDFDFLAAMAGNPDGIQALENCCWLTSTVRMNEPAPTWKEVFAWRRSAMIVQRAARFIGEAASRHGGFVWKTCCS